MDEFATNRRSYWLSLFGRLNTGVSIEQAEAGINRRYRPIIKEVAVRYRRG